jgi:ubiquinone/menaquinone biosynthesis C-methylase UbiE
MMEGVRLRALLFVLFLACSRKGDVAHTPALLDASLPFVRVPAEPMGWQGAGWLERPERDAEEQPEKVLDALELSAGEIVADVGAGTGYFALRMARRVSPGGRVLATDIQPEMLARLQANAEASHVTNVEPILATEDDARLPADAVDLALMVDVYHELSHPAATLGQVRRALRASGRLVLVEYRGEDPTVPIKPEHRMTLAQVRAEIEPSGFRFVTSLEFLSRQHVIIFAR